jgi:Uma2 family endonuclease
MELSPDWVCEVLSPSTAAFDRTRKLDVYGRVGVAHVWLVDPIARTLEVLRRERAHGVLAATYVDRDKARIEPFDAIELDLAFWWGDV